MLTGKAKRLLLLLGKRQTKLRFDLRRNSFRIRHAAVFILRHGEQALCRVGLRLVQACEIAPVAPGDALTHQFAALYKRVHALGDQLVRHAAELRRCRQQVAVRDEAVAANGVISKFIQRRRGDTLRALIIKAVAECQRVRLLKRGADGVRNEYVGVVLHELQGLVAVILVHPQSDDRANVRRGQKLDQAAHTCLPPEIGRHGLCLGEADALDGRELFRLVLQHVQRITAEARHEQRRRRRADAAHGAPGEIGIDRVRRLRHGALGKLSLELLTVRRVRHPAAGDDHGLARHGVWNAADDHRLAAVVHVQLEDGVAVFLILIDDRRDGAA